MRQTQGMNVVTVNKDELLKTIRENRDKHHSVFLEAQEGFKTAIVEALEKRLEDARLGRHIDQHLGLVEPMDQTKEYDRIITMLEMSVDDQIELTQDEFASYVMDDWSWKRQWVMSNSTYTAGAIE